MKRYLLCCTSALCLAPIALAAQDQAAETPFQLDPIYVSGAKRAETALDYAGTVGQADAKALQNQSVRRVSDLDKVFAGLAIDAQSSRAYTNISVRGAASLDFYNPSVQLYLDGIPQDAGMLGQMLPGDLASVELLYGPQGTLYGRGAVGGVLNVTTLRPGEGPQFNFEAEGGNGQRGAGFKAGTELSPGFWADIAYRYQREDNNLIRNGSEDVGGATLRNGRIRLRYAPEDSLWDVMFSAQHNDVDSTEEYFVLNSNRENRQVLPFPSRYEQTTNTFGLTADYDLGWGQLTSITSYQDRELDRTIFGSYTPETQQTLSQELRISGETTNGLSYVAGLFVQDSDFNRQARGTTVDISTRTTALFGDLTWQARPRLKLTAGLRLDHEKSTASASGAGVVSAGQDSWNDVSPKLGASYEIRDGLHAYGLISTGFKAGGFTRTAATSNVAFSYDPQNSYNGETGLKYQSADGSLSASLAAYYTLTKDYQMFVGDVPFQYLQNVGEVTSKGLEAQLAYRNGGWGLRLGAAYNNAKFSDYHNPLNPAANRTGNSVPYAPEITVTAAIDRSFELGAGRGTLTPRISLSYRSEAFFDTANAIQQDGYVLIDAGLTWELENGVELDLYAANLTDETYAEYGFGRAPGDDALKLGRGREVGLVLRKTF